MSENAGNVSAQVQKRLEALRGYYHQFSLQERDRRWNRIREGMFFRGIECLLVWASDVTLGMGNQNLRYLTQLYDPCPSLVYFPKQGDPISWLGLPHVVVGMKAVQNWVSDIRPSTRFAEVIDAIKRDGYENDTVGIVGYGAPPPVLVFQTVLEQPMRQIRKGLPNANFVDASSLLEEVRMIKSPAEIACLEKSAELIYLMFEQMVASAKPGVQECQVYANMLHACYSNGGEEPMVLLDTGYPPLLHGRFPPYSTRPLNKGDFLIAEFHSNYAGYLVSTNHTVCIGKPPPAYQKIHDVCVESLHSGMESLRPGALFKEVVEAFRAPVKKAKMGWLECGIHGHGLGSGELPATTLMSDMNMKDMPPVEIRENVVVGIDISLHDPAWSTESGVKLGETAVVTKGGARRLTRIPLELTVV